MTARFVGLVLLGLVLLAVRNRVKCGASRYWVRNDLLATAVTTAAVRALSLG